MKDLLKSLAPLLGTAIAGPLGGIAASFLADKLGIEAKTVEAVTEALSEGKMTPDQVAGIKAAEIEFAKFCKTHQIDLEKVHAADRDSARGMQMTSRSHVPAALTYLLTFGFFGVLTAMFTWPEIKESAPLMYMLGSLNAAWTGACAFWMGTTSSSQNKNEMLAKASFK